MNKLKGGLIKIRYPRLAKFRRKNRKKTFLAQVVIFSYVLFMSMGFLTSYTGAYFNDSHVVSNKIQAGIWDYSMLDFPKKGNDNLNEFSCQETAFEISTVIKNIGMTKMFAVSTYEIYYLENGDPSSEKGSKIAEGEIPKLLAGQEMELKHFVPYEGFYMFKALEKPGQEDEKIIWSEKIKVNCKNGQSANANNEEIQAVNNHSTIQENSAQAKEKSTTEETLTENSNPQEKKETSPETITELNTDSLEEQQNNEFNNENQEIEGEEGEGIVDENQ